MPDTSKLSKYLKPEHVNDGDTITFVDAGIVVEKEWKTDGEPEIKKALEITVRFRGEDKTYSPNGTTIKLLSAAWGVDSEGWIDKQASLLVVPGNNGKDYIVAKPLVEKKQKHSDKPAGNEETVPF